jgi:hypothetical protein
VTKTATPPAPKLESRDVYAVAIEADVNERTVRARLAGNPTQPTTKRRIDRALRDLGFADRIPPEAK